MPFERKPQVYSASIDIVTIGTGEAAATLGGENTMPLFSFDAPCANRPLVGIEISDLGFDESLPQLAQFYAGAQDVVEQAKRAMSAEGADFLAVSLEGADPNGANNSVEDTVALAVAICDAVDCPVAFEGCKNIDKDTQLFEKLAEALQGKNVLLLSAREENYKTVAAAAGLAYGQKLGAESAVDINLAKQLNVMIGQLGVKNENVVMNLGSAAVGYGYEYVASTMERVRLAGLEQNDAALQMPIVTPVAGEAWGVREAVTEQDANPQWGPREERGIQMEISTAASSLTAGSNAVIVRHPESVKTISAFIAALM